MTTLLSLLIVALSFRLSHNQETRSSSSRREASEEEETAYVGHDNRASALKTICLKVRQEISNEFGTDLEAETGIWTQDDADNFAINLHKKPDISRSKH